MGNVESWGLGLADGPYGPQARIPDFMCSWLWLADGQLLETAGYAHWRWQGQHGTRHMPENAGMEIWGGAALLPGMIIQHGCQ